MAFLFIEIQYYSISISFTIMDQLTVLIENFFLTVSKASDICFEELIVLLSELCLMLITSRK